MTRRKACHGVAPRLPGGLLQPGVDGLESDPGAVDSERHADKQHRGHDAPLGPVERHSQVGRRAAGPSGPAEQEQQRDPGDGVRHHQRQVNQGLDHAPAPEATAGQEVGQRHPEQRRDHGGDRRRLQAQQHRVPDRGCVSGVPQAGHRRGRHQPDDRQHDEREQQAAEQPGDHAEPARRPATGGPPRFRRCHGVIVPPRGRPGRAVLGGLRPGLPVTVSSAR